MIGRHPRVSSVPPHTGKPSKRCEKGYWNIQHSNHRIYKFGSRQLKAEILSNVDLAWITGFTAWSV
jgi:hypothetical protein